MQPQGEIQSQRTRYSSKKDAWIVIVICAALLLSTLGILRAFLSGDWVGLITPLVVWVLVVSLAVPLYYEITSSTLIVRSGLLRREIPLASIQRVYPTRNPLSAPAMSLDRLQVDYTKDGQAHFVRISPKDKLGFLRDLAQSAGDLEVRDGSAIRRQ